MFVILRPVEVPEKFFKKRKMIKEIARSPAVLHRENGALPFCTLDVASQKINWTNVAEKCGRYASRIVAPVNFPLPDGTPLRRFVPCATVHSFVLNTAVKHLRAARPDPHSFVLTLTDRLSLLSLKIVDLIELCACVRIVTARPEKYAVACENALNNYGASLILRSCYEPTQKPDIVICADGAISSSMKNAAVFTAKNSSCGKVVFSLGGVELLSQHRELLPDGAREIDLAGALTELCGSTAYSNAFFNEIGISCNKCTPPNVEKCILCHIGQTQTKLPQFCSDSAAP